MDQHQNMFVCSSGNDKLIRVSRDGDKCEVLLSHDDMLYLPQAVHYDKENMEMMVVDGNSVVKKYFVT